MAILTSDIGTARDHADIGTWEAATDYDLVTAEDIERGDVYDDFDHAGFVGMAGATASALYYRHLIAAAGEEYNLLTGVGVYWNAVGSVLIIDENYFRASNISIFTNQGVAVTIGTMTGVRLDSCYLGVFTLNNDGEAIRTNGIDNIYSNCVLFSQGTGAGTAGIITYGGGGATNFLIQNCVIYFFNRAGSGYGISMGATRTVSIHNTIIMDCNDNWGQLAGSAATSSNNMSSSGTSFGSSPSINAVLADVFVDVAHSRLPNDFNLKPASAAIGAGVDRSVSGIITDFIGTPWGTIWDMGVFKFPEAPSGDGNTSNYYYYYLYRR